MGCARCVLAPRPLLLLLLLAAHAGANAGVSPVVLGTSSSSSSSILCAARDANRKAKSAQAEERTLHPSFVCTHLASPLATTTSMTSFARSSCRAARSVATRRTLLSGSRLPSRWVWIAAAHLRATSRRCFDDDAAGARTRATRGGARVLPLGDVDVESTARGRRGQPLKRMLFRCSSSSRTFVQPPHGALKQRSFP